MHFKSLELASFLLVPFFSIVLAGQRKNLHFPCILYIYIYIPTFAFMLLTESFAVGERNLVSKESKQSKQTHRPLLLERAEGMWNKSKRKA